MDVHDKLTFSGKIIGYRELGTFKTAPWSETNPRMKGMARLLDSDGTILAQVTGRNINILTKNIETIQRLHGVVGGELCITSVRLKTTIRNRTNDDVIRILSLNGYDTLYDPDTGVHNPVARKKDGSIQLLGRGKGIGKRTIIINSKTEEDVFRLLNEMIFLLGDDE